MRANCHVQPAPVRNNDFGDTVQIGASTLAPQAHRGAPHAEIEVAVDDGDDETCGTYDLRRGRLTPKCGDLCAAELALRVLGSATGSGQPNEQQCHP